MMSRDRLLPENSLFAVVSFEGIDAYSQAGGLGVRVAGLVETLAELGNEVHLFFIGDPTLPGREVRLDGCLTLHRWARWISANCPGGVYDGEAAKVVDVTTSLPPYLVETLLAPAIAAHRIPIVLFEEWQTAECACRVADELSRRGLAGRAILVWNANNTYGFERIDWPRLAAAVTITTISRHMRAIIRSCGADARVIPNGIPDGSFDPVKKADVASVRAALERRTETDLLFKMARWQREKGWTQALDAIAHSRTLPSGSTGVPVLIARAGGPSGLDTSPAAELEQHAAARGLRTVAFDSERELTADLGDAIGAGADVVNLRFGVAPRLARTLYAAAAGVLANSVAEPFGLVGLEAMAAGGVAYTGGTGEDYAVAGRNAVVLETLDPREIIGQWDWLAASPEAASQIRRAARRTAREYRWHAIVEVLLGFLTNVARRQGLLADRAAWHSRADRRWPSRVTTSARGATPASSR